MSWTKRRACPRARIRLEAAYEDAERQVFFQSRDISEEGIYLFAPDPPEVGSRAKLVLDLPGHSEILRITGWVARRDTGSQPGFAVHFDHPDQREDRRHTPPSGDRDVLRRFVNDTTSSTRAQASS